MKTTLTQQLIKTLLVCWLFSVSHAGLAAAALPTDSLYQLPVTLQDQDNRTYDLATLQGKPVLISMFYTSCQFVCPMLIDTMAHIRGSLPAEEQQQAMNVIVSFDPQRDTVPVLKQVVTKRQLQAGWTLARTDERSARKLAAALNIQYKKLADGDYNHSTVVLLLDKQGKIMGRTNKMGSADPAFVKLVRDTLQQTP